MEEKLSIKKDKIERKNFNQIISETDFFRWETIKVLFAIGFIYGFFIYLTYIRHFPKVFLASSYDAAFLLSALGIFGGLCTLFLGLMLVLPWTILGKSSLEIKEKIIKWLIKSQHHTQHERNSIHILVIGILFFLAFILFFSFFRLLKENYFWGNYLFVSLTISTIYYFLCEKASYWKILFAVILGLLPYLSIYSSLLKFNIGSHVSFSIFLEALGLLVLIGMLFSLLFNSTIFRPNKNNIIVAIVVVLAGVTICNKIFYSSYRFSANLLKTLNLGNINNMTLLLSKEGEEKFRKSSMQIIKEGNMYLINDIDIILHPGDTYYVKPKDQNDVFVVSSKDIIGWR